MALSRLLQPNSTLRVCRSGFSAARARLCSSACSDGNGDSPPLLKEESAREDPNTVLLQHMKGSLEKLDIPKATSLGNVMQGYSGPHKRKTLSALFTVHNSDPTETVSENEGREHEETLMGNLKILISKQYERLSQSNECQKVHDIKSSSIRSANDQAAMETDRPRNLASIYRSLEKSNEPNEDDAEKDFAKDLVDCIKLQNVAPNPTKHCSSTGVIKGNSLNDNLQKPDKHDRLDLLAFPEGTSTTEDVETIESGVESVGVKELKVCPKVSLPKSNKDKKQRRQKNTARPESEGNNVIVRFLRSSLPDEQIFKFFSTCGEILKIEYPDAQGTQFFKVAHINFKTREGLEKAIDVSGSHIFGPITVESATSENRTTTIPVPSLLGDPDIPAALVKNPTRTIRIEHLNREISSHHIVDALGFCKSNVSSYFLGSSDSVAYVELETEVGKERALAKHSINVLGRHLVMLRIDCPRTTVVRISSTDSLEPKDAVSICKSLGDISGSLVRSPNVIDVCFKFTEWSNMLKILNRLNGCMVGGTRLQAEAATVFPPDVLLALWRHPEERKHLKATALSLLHKLDCTEDTSELAFLQNDFFSRLRKA